MYDFEPRALSRSTFQGEQTERTWRVCLATVGDVDVELVEPIFGERSYTDHLVEHGEGFHHAAVFSFADPGAAVESYRETAFRCFDAAYTRTAPSGSSTPGRRMNGVLFETVELGAGVLPNRTRSTRR